MILVTGAYHFMGQAVVQALMAQQHEVEVWQPTSGFNAIESCTQALQNCRMVIYLAQQDSKNPQAAQLASHLVSSCLQSGVKRLVHVSSIYGLGYPTPDGMLGDETTPYNWPALPTALTYHTHQVEQAIWQAASQLEVVMVNPTLILGKGCPFYPFYFHVWPGCPTGGTTVIHFAAAVSGIIAAAFQGRAGERYILGGALVRHKEIFEMLSKLGQPSPSFRVLSPWTLKCLSYWYACLGKSALLNREEASRLTKRLYYASDKAARELQLPSTALKQTVRETLVWYQEQGYI